MSKFIKIFVLLAVLSLGATVLPVFAAGTFSGSAADNTSIELEVTCPDHICLVRGCTDRAANNYNPAAGYDDGSCTYTPPPSDILGCTDPAAVNYNPLASVNNGSCRYYVPNVSNFTATPAGSGARLSWRNPSYRLFSSVTIVKAVGHIPTGLTDGEIIYDGAGSSVSDSGLSIGTNYYYLAIVKGTDGNNSSGAVTSYTPEENVQPPEEPPVVVVPGTVGPGGGGGSNYVGVGMFDRLPVGTTTPSVIEALAQVSRLFVLTQPGEPAKSFSDGSYLKIKGNKTITISVDYYKMPEALKTIGLTLYDRADPTRTFSFLFKLNEAKAAYEATIGPLSQDGEYGVQIYLINYDDQTIRKWGGQLAVVGSLGILGVNGEKFVRQVAGPVAVTGGALAGILQLLFASGSAGTLTEVYLLLLRQFGALLGYFGLKKKNQPWGTVYDSITKRPIDPAYVSVLSGGEEVATAITDIDGRFGFSLLDGNYSLSAGKTHYRFPSTILAGRPYDEMYGNLYFGGEFHVGAGEVLSKNIPLDPIGFDWNEFVKGQGSFLKIFNRRELWRAKLTRIVYIVGLIASLFYLVFYPSIFNILAPTIYLAIYLAGRYYRRRHKVVTVKNGRTGEPVSFAIIRVFYADGDMEVKKVVTDMIGRFYLLLRPGVYRLAVDHKQPDGTYARIYESGAADLPKGIWEKDILI